MSEPVVTLCDGGQREWFAFHLDCPRCWAPATWFGYTQLWYGSRAWCSRCGALKDENGYVHQRTRRRHRGDALWARAQFVAWLLAGSPRIDLEAELGLELGLTDGADPDQQQRDTAGSAR